jgi:AraC-like DNA-binding protein
MTVYLKYNLHALCEAVVKEQMQKLNIPFAFKGTGELIIRQGLSPEREKQLKQALEPYGIEIMDDPRTELVQRIKDAITDMVYDEREGAYKFSVYLSEKLNYSYTHLSNVFPEETHTSIEHFVILKKIEYAKELIVDHNMSMTEVAHRLRYSSLAHFSSQFKKATGLTPSVFRRIIQKKK